MRGIFLKWMAQCAQIGSRTRAAVCMVAIALALAAVAAFDGSFYSLSRW